MLEKLHIKNVALIEECDVAFGEGLNILTGETGAGKSMLIGSLLFVLGGRSGKDFLRRGKKSAQVEALFTIQGEEAVTFLEENGIETEEDGTVVLARSLSDTGKTVCRINGNMVTVGTLRGFAEGLVDLYGQHDHQSLLNPKKHIALLDIFCESVFQEKLKAYDVHYKKTKEIDRQLDALLGDERQREQRLDILLFQKEEIEEANLVAGEEESLLERRKRISNLDKLERLTQESVIALYDGDEATPSAVDLLGDVLSKLEDATALDAELGGYLAILQDTYAQIEDVAREIKHYAQNLEEESESLEEIEERLQLIYKLKRKYGNSVEEILAFYSAVLEEIDFLSNSQERVEMLMEEKARERVKLEEAGEALTQMRKDTARRIETQIESSLQDMEMKHARFFVSITQKEEWGANGRDKVEFLIQPNLGEEAKHLAKIASGGEMSRVMLALKSVLVDADQIGTFVFDEIDTGVSGRTAGKVGEKMAELAKKRQILCITHLPQIAAMADAHFLIEKQVEGEETKTKVFHLEEENAVQEVARLLGSAEITETTLAAARELKVNKQ